MHGACMIDKLIVRVPGAVVEQAGHSGGDSLGGFGLAGRDVGDGG